MSNLRDDIITLGSYMKKNMPNYNSRVSMILNNFGIKEVTYKDFVEKFPEVKDKDVMQLFDYIRDHAYEMGVYGSELNTHTLRKRSRSTKRVSAYEGRYTL